MRIKNVINNNILCVVDEKGNGMIVTGRGLGLKLKKQTILKKIPPSADSSRGRYPVYCSDNLSGYPFLPPQAAGKGIPVSP